MQFHKESIDQCNIHCIPFDLQYFQEYIRIYNECFYEMRKALDIEPYNFLNDYSQISEKANNIYLYIHNDEIVGSVACYGNEIDDLIVNKKYQNNGYGKQLLLWGMQGIRQRSFAPIILHVAEWNKDAISLYKKIGFEVASIERVR